MTEIVSYVATASGLALNTRDFSCWCTVHVVVKTVLFLVSTGLAVFNTRTDWNVVFSYQEVGFNNPLLPRSIDWLRALYLFASIGTILTVITVFHDGLVLLYSLYKAMKAPCCKNKSNDPNQSENMIALHESLLPSDGPTEPAGWESTHNGRSDEPRRQESTLNTSTNEPDEQESTPDNSTNEQEEQASTATNEPEGQEPISDDSTNQPEEQGPKHGDDDINDPFKPCYHCGCNVDTRSENLGCIALWFQDVPMLTIAVLYAFSQTTCRVPDNRDVTPFLRDIGISATAATLASFWKLIRSFYRVYISVGVRIKERDKCTNCTHVQKCFPKKGDALYPPGTRTQYCIFPFFVGLAFQLSAIAMAVGVTAGVWISYGILLQTPNSDNSLGVYRLSTYDLQYVRLLDISDILSSNGSFVLLEQIPNRELLFEDIYCLSEFDYRSEDSQIFFNAVQLEVISSDGHFCVSTAGLNSCGLYYKFLSYASVEPITGEVELFELRCSVVQYDFNYDGKPVIDFSINVSQQIDRSNFPLNGEQLVIFYPSPISIYLPVSIISTVGTPILHTFEDLLTATNITCIIRFVHDLDQGRINFDYRDVYNYQQSNCFCSFSPGPNCNQFHGNAYATQDNFVTPYTHCSEIPEEKLKPYHDLTIAVECPC